MAERAAISRVTLHKIERGSPGVAIGNYAAVLFTMGMIDRLGDLADPRYDAVGSELAHEQLPQRIRLSRRERPGKA
jgi:hypothetical protein